jgi:signal transduction histidine kinase/HAMP domain-containing protein
MTPILTALSSPPYLDLLNSTLGWLGWLVLLGVIITTVVRFRDLQRSAKPRAALLILFSLLALLANLFMGVRLSSGVALPEPGIPSGPHNPALMAFSALPWMLAGGFLGPLDALIVGALAGLTRCLWDTHNLFTILETSALAVAFSLAVRQRYRTLFYRAMRQPLVVALVLVPVYALLSIYGSVFLVNGGLAARLDFALTNLGPASLATGGELLLAGLFVQVIGLALPRQWGGQPPLEPSPAERSLQTRVLTGGGAFIVILLFSVILGDWIVAGNAARRMVNDRLASTAQAASESVPYFLETGQNLATRLAADPRVLSGSGEALNAVLAEQMHTLAYFDEIFVLDSSAHVLAAYPSKAAASLRLTQQENLGIPLAVQGVTAQAYTIPPVQGATTAGVSFMAAVLDGSGKTRRILLGHSQLADNPLIQPLIHNLQAMASSGGDGKLLDEQARVLFSSNPDELMSTFTGQAGQSPRFYDAPAPRGTRSLVYYQPVAGRPWAVILSVPAAQAQQLALDIASPLAILVLILAVIALVSLRLSLRIVTSSLQNLVGEAGRIAQGQLDHPLPVEGVDEVGQVRRAFEQMRISLHARLEELNQLLLVSQGVASTLEMGGAVQPILEAVLASGASAVRVALMSSAQPDEEAPLHFALGPARDTYAFMDEAILALAQKQPRLVFNNLGRGRGMDIPDDQPRPSALAAVALYHENRYYGVLWAAFSQPHQFTEEEMRFLSTLAGQAALAAANARLYRTAEVGRQRLGAILASTPDPVLVTDQENRLILTNPAAKRALAVLAGAEGLPSEQVISQQELRSLLQELESGNKSAELVMPDGKVYFATASSVIADGRPVGRVCVMRDVTHFKQLDALKSDFVSSVSHDLRSPLTLMRGYATMLEMVGNLNEQQKGYVAKIVVGVESMSRMVTNLLDLGRIDAGVGLQVEKTVLMDIVKALMEPLQLVADQKKIALTLAAASDLPVAIDADRALLQQALYNLVENAIKYTPGYGSVALRINARPQGIQFEVQDTGIGIAPVDLPRLFEKFFRGSQREARAQRGSGLGLAIVRSIAERHGGKVWVESLLGQGSTFFLLIPLGPDIPVRSG